jgi:hypothetical protein
MPPARRPAVEYLMRLRSVLMLVLFASVWARAAEPDLSSPREAARSLYKAVDAEDGEAILKIFDARDESERELAKAFADLIVAGKKLADATKAKFNTSGESLGAGVITKEELAKLDQADVKEEGDIATLTTAGQARPMRFHRTGKQWQLIVADFANVEEIGVSHQVFLLKKVAGVMSDMAGEIQAGKYATNTDAEAAIQTKLANVMIAAARFATTKPSTAATTKPSTAPTTKP